jgi:RNA polymerase sigma factor for flagellar operon FliA
MIQSQKVTRENAPVADRRSGPRKAPGFASRRSLKLSMGMTKAELIERSRHRVRLIAVKMCRNLPSSVDLDDLIGMGYLGLMDAADHFDPSKGIKFETFAEFRIRGSILDELRKLDFVSRTTRDQVNALKNAEEAVRARTGDHVTPGEICKELDMSLDKLHEIVKHLGSTVLINLEDLPPGNELDDSSIDDPFRAAVKQELKAMIENVFHKLPDQEQTVIKLYYFRGLNLREISEIIGLTESRISQIHTHSIKLLRAEIKGLSNCSVESIFQSLLED